jgi:hypothetical protein
MAIVNREESTMVKQIPGLRGTPTHRLSVALYQRHHDRGTGACTFCGRRAPCPALPAGTRRR